MTAEILVMNRQAVALAADSAVTLGGATDAKIYASANKIFSLSKHRPVGVMIYGNADLLDLPWETSIKKYRANLKDRSFASLHEYAEDLVRWLGANRLLFPADVQRGYVSDAVSQFMKLIVDSVESRVADVIKQKAGITETETEHIIDDVVTRQVDMWDGAPALPFVADGHATSVGEVYVPEIVRAVTSHFEKLPLSDDARDKLYDLAVALVSKVPPSVPDGTTGLVVSGFGTEDLFPSFVEVIVDGVANDNLVCWTRSVSSIERGMEAQVCAFAQSEMVTRFMEGVDPDYQLLLERSLSEILRGFTNEMYRLLKGRAPAAAVRRQIDEAREAMLDDYVERLAQLRGDRYVGSILDAVSSLPVDELADMAESLVNLTSFKRRVSMELESVGGPIDVAVITPGDGFIWIKRKHYFEPDRNQQFFANYYRED